jgi:putative selenate reductase
MDCARAAARNQGVEEAVIVYRRTIELMPAQREEVALALADGVRIIELCAPEQFVGGHLLCSLMTLGETDASGRPGIASTGQTVEMNFDTVINAVGAKVDTGLFADNGIEVSERGLALVDEANNCSIEGVYVAGDCKSGPQTVVKAMADAKTIARDILTRLGLDNAVATHEPKLCRSELLALKGMLQPASPPGASIGRVPQPASPPGALIGRVPDHSATGQDSADARRCLACSLVCEVCVDVCPNRANVSIDLGDVIAGFEQRYQVLHLDGLCNECGNCGSFCPTAGRPYLDKLTLFASEEDFYDSANKGFVPCGDGGYRIRLEDGSVIEGSLGEGFVIEGSLVDGSLAGDSASPEDGSFVMPSPEDGAFIAGTGYGGPSSAPVLPARFATLINTVEAHYAYLLRVSD